MSTSSPNQGYTVGTVNFLSTGGTTTGGSTGGNEGTGGGDPIGPNWSSDKGDFTATWEINGNTITFLMKAQSTGWISLGVADNPSMTNADYFTGWVCLADD